MKAVSVCSLLALVLCCLACESEEDKQRLEQLLIQTNVEQRLVEYERLVERNCREKVFEAATIIADSLIIAEARLLKDTLLKPFKPERPEQPELKRLEDTVPIRPFLPRPAAIPLPDTTKSGN